MINLKYFYDTDIVETHLVCPYCMNNASGKSVCCGESSAHFEEAYVDADFQTYLLSEVYFVPRLPIGASNVHLSN